MKNVSKNLTTTVPAEGGSSGPRRLVRFVPIRGYEKRQLEHRRRRQHHKAFGSCLKEEQEALRAAGRALRQRIRHRRDAAYGVVFSDDPEKIRAHLFPVSRRDHIG